MRSRTLAALLLALVSTLPGPASRAPSPVQSPAPTARQLIARIVAATGVAPSADTVDTIKAGDPETLVTGIVTTFMDTYEVLQKAVAAGDNLIITHEPTFYNHLDDRTLFPGNPVVAAKLHYIEEHHLVVWRFHDLWHDRDPDGILQGEIAALGWTRYRAQTMHANHTSDPAANLAGAPPPEFEAQDRRRKPSTISANQVTDPEAPHLFHLPPTTVGALATRLRARSGSPVVRVVGDPSLLVTQAALLPGASGLHHQVTLLERNDVQVLVAGESAEWEAVEYVRDAAALARAGQGKPKALILLGHEPSEEAGMRECATWLQTILPGIRIDFISAGSPFTAVIKPQ